MKTAGIIAEYNPFHKGHEYHIQKTKELTAAEYVIVVMSGDFVQRGEPSCLSKYNRTRQALLGGADLVLELPCRFSTASAHRFAYGGVSMLNSLGVVDFLSFGYEGERSMPLRRIADIITEEADEFKKVLDEKIREGISYPAARQEAILGFFKEEERQEAAVILSLPNNILALEYLKAISLLDAGLDPVYVKRLGDGYKDDISGKGFPSAAGLRKQMYEARKAGLENGQDRPIMPDDFTDLIAYKIEQERHKERDFTAFEDVSLELANRIKNGEYDIRSFERLCMSLKSKQYTYSRISRVLMHILLDIKRTDKSVEPGYARILGFRKEASELVKRIEEKSSIPLIKRPAEAEKMLTGEAYLQFKEDVFASELYENQSARVFDNTDVPRFNEYKQNLTVI